MCSDNKMCEITFRLELESDYRVVEELTREAFWNLYVPGADEHFIIHKMRNSPEFVRDLSLVAESQGRIVGAIFYTLSTIESHDKISNEVLTFGPVSVLPQMQGKGIGSMLIHESIKLAKQMGHRAIVIQGYPAYYKRFGFRNSEAFGIHDRDGRYPKAMMALELAPGSLDGIRGRLLECSAFDADPAEVDAFDGAFPAKPKFETASQRAYAIMSALRHDDEDPAGIDSMARSVERLAATP